MDKSRGAWQPNAVPRASSKCGARHEACRPVVSRGRDAEYSEYVAARLSSLRRLAAVLCDDWQRADDLVQATLIKLYVRWGRVRAATHPDAYARAVLVRESIHERRSVWVKRVSLSGGLSDSPAAAVDQDAVLDLRAAVAALPPRQRATLVLRYYCDLNVDQAAEILGCSPGTVKSQTARALEAVRRALGPAPAAGSGGQPAAAAEHQIYQEAPGHD
jgi:RNA polymerase sigma-70 factor (sigma-E family)